MHICQCFLSLGFDGPTFLLGDALTSWQVVWNFCIFIHSIRSFWAFDVVRMRSRKGVFGREKYFCVRQTSWFFLLWSQGRGSIIHWWLTGLFIQSFFPHKRKFLSILKDSGISQRRVMGILFVFGRFKIGRDVENPIGFILFPLLLSPSSLPNNVCPTTYMHHAMIQN